MKIYHGTTDIVALRSLREGLTTRASRRAKSRWTEHPSRADAIYLTDAYALYFAMHVLRPKHGKRAGIVEVDLDLLDPYDLVPDEDVLEQIGRMRGDDGVKGDIGARTAHYRKRLHEYRGAHHQSIAAMGTCAHLGNIPAEAITRIALIDPLKQSRMCWTAMDPTITIMNYQLIGGKYRDLTASIFEGPKDGIEVITK